MELEDKKRNDIICLQASLIYLKRDRQNKKRCYERGDKEILKQMAQLQDEIKQKQRQIDCMEIYIDGKPLTDLELERRMEEDFEKELEELEKLEEEKQEKERERKEFRRHLLEKNGW